MPISEQYAQTFNVKLPKKMIARIRRMAKLEGRTQTWIVQTAIRELFERLEREHNGGK